MGHRRRVVLAAGSAILVALALDPIAGTASSQPLGGAHKVQNLLARSRQVLLAPRLAGVATPGQVSPPDSNIYSTTAAAVDPTNHANLFAAANMLTAPPDAGFISTNSGTTWSMSTVPLPGTSPNTFAFYPGAAFDASGALYFSSMPYSVTGTAVNTQIVVSKSFDKGSTWAAPATVESSNIPEKPLLAVDTTASSYHNRVYVGYDTNPAHGSEPLVMAHSDDGQTWTKTQIVDTGGDFGAVPAVGPGGDVYVAWDDWCGFRSGGTCQNSAGRILLARSTNGGASFDALGSPALIAGTTIGFGVVPPNYSNSCGGVGPNAVNPAPSLDVDRSGGVHNGSLYAAWADAQASGSRLHIYLSRSLDNGAHWSSPVQLDTGNQNDAWQPALSVDQTNGAVTVAWYDRRDDVNNKLYGVYYTQSTDGGITFLTSQVPLTSGHPSDPTLDCNATGDYMQMAAVDGLAHPFWSDTRNGINQIFTTAIDEAVIAQSVPPPAQFRPAANYGVGTSPTGLVAGDFNGDGKRDIATVNSGSNTLSILLGNGDGTFQPSTSFSTGALSSCVVGCSVAAGDVNGDGKLDLVVGNGGDSTVSVLLGNGDGTFQAAKKIATPNIAPFGIVLADFNHDGRLDIAFATAGSNSAAVMLGNGDGTFQAPITYQSGPFTTALAVGEFDGDAAPDLAVTNSSGGTISILKGNGDGTFQTAALYPVGSGSSSIAVGDLNRDNAADVVTANSSSGTVSVLLGKGQGTFQPAVNYSVLPSAFGPEPYSVAIQDMNGDGRPDLIVARILTSQATDPGGVSVLLGKGDGTFQTPVNYLANDSPDAVIATDLVGDHRQDIVAANRRSNDVSVLLGIAPSMTPSPSALSFPPVTARHAGPVQSINVTNSGSGDLRIAIVKVAGANAPDFMKVGDTCSGATVSAGASCAVSLRFAPKSVGDKTATLQITDDAATSPQLVSLTGTALVRLPSTVPLGSPRNREISPPPPPPPRVHAPRPSQLVAEGQPLPSPLATPSQQIPSPLAGAGQGIGDIALVSDAMRVFWSDLLSAFRILIR